MDELASGEACNDLDHANLDNRPTSGEMPTKARTAKKQSPRPTGTTLQQQLGDFLRKRRGEESGESFAKKLGISRLSLWYIEKGRQNVRLRMLQKIVDGLGCKLGDIFPDVGEKAPTTKIPTEPKVGTTQGASVAKHKP